MQQHAVPQNVTQYQFRLVGDMTLKQFLELLGGLVVAYLFYSSNLIFFIKWPLGLGSILFGFGLAFFPIEDRPLDQWIINFLKSIYAPTRYIWKKSNKVPHIFTFEPHAIIDTVTATKTVKAPAPASQERENTADISDEERQRLNVLDAMLAKAAPAVPAKPLAKPAVPLSKPSITVRKLKPLTEVSTVFQSTPRPQPVAKPTTISLNDKVNIPAAQPTPIPAAPAAAPAAVKSEPNLIFSKPSTVAAPKPAPTATPVNIRLPAAPSTPNIVVGMVVDKEGKIVENAIVQIVTSDGVPARAIKTNSLGQFYTSTPLSKGVYTIEADRDGFSFPPNKLNIEDRIVAPLLIKAS